MPEGTDDADDLLSVEAYQQVEVDVSMENITSSTGVIGQVRTYGDYAFRQSEDPLVIQLMEFRPSGVALDVPPKSGAAGHSVRVNFDVRGAKLPFNFTAKGVIDKVTPLEGGREKFEITFTDFDREYLEALRSIFEQRQDEIDRFLEQVRG